MPVASPRRPARASAHLVVPALSFLVPALALLLSLLGAAAPTVRAQTDGATNFVLLQQPASARAAALAGALGAADAGGVDAFVYNPALIGAATHRDGALTYLNHLLDVNAGFLAYGRRLGRSVHGAAGLRFLSYGSFERTDENGLEDGTFRAGEAVLSAAAARAFGDRLTVGLSGHLAHSTIETADASALVFDVGARYRLPARGLTLGLAARRLGSALDRFADQRLRLPADLQVSLRKHLRHLPLTLFATGYDLLRPTAFDDGRTLADRLLRHVVAGGEVRLADEAVLLRLGYDHRRRLDTRQSDRLDLAGLSAGFGVQVAALHVDYAYTSWSTLGGLHYFTVRTRL